MRLNFATLSSPLQKTGGQGGTWGTTNSHAGLSRPHLTGDAGDTWGQTPGPVVQEAGCHVELSPMSPNRPQHGGHKKRSVHWYVPAVPNVPAFLELNATASPDRRCWPHTEAMNTAEIDTFTARLHLFTWHGLDGTEAERLADGLVARDRDEDDRRLCFECDHLRPGGALWHCKQWRRAGFVGAGVTDDAAKLLQRCGGFKEATQ